MYILLCINRVAHTQIRVKRCCHVGSVPCIRQKAAVTVTTEMMAALANTVDDIDNVMKWQHDKL